MSGQSLVSIIIPTLNSSNVLRECLHSIRNQTHNNIEVIVVDDYSADETREIAKEFDALVTIYGPGQDAPFAKVFGAPIQQCFGVSTSHGDYVFLVDSDMMLRPRVVEKCVAEADAGAAAVVIPEISVGKSFWAKCKKLEKTGYSGESLESPRFIARAVWDDIGGIDPQTGGFYDWDLTDRIKARGYKTVKIDEAIIHEEGELSLRRLMRKKYTYGKYLRAYADKKVLTGAEPMIARFTPYRFLHYLRSQQVREQGPAMLLGLIIMKSFESIALLLGSLSAELS